MPSTQKPVALHVTFTVNDAKAAEFEAACREALPSFKEEEGCLEYIVSKDRERPNVYHFREEFADKDAHTTHINSPAFKVFREKTIEKKGVLVEFGGFYPVSMERL